MNRKKVQKMLAATVAAFVIGCGASSYSQLEAKVEQANSQNQDNEVMISFLTTSNEKLENENSDLKQSVALLSQQNEQLEQEMARMRNVPVSRGSSRSIDVEATAYSLGGFTANGTSLSGRSREDAMVIAVDPDLIPLGSQVYITFEEPWSHYNGVYTAADTGSAINGNIIDVFVGHDNDDEAMDFGRRAATVQFL